MTNAIYSDPTTNATDFLRDAGAACFPVQPDKAPLPGYKWTDPAMCSTDPARWAEWINAGHSLAINAGASRLIVVDIDAKDDSAGAWSIWCAKCAEWGIPPVAMPSWSTPGGGWHALFRPPEGVDPAMLRQPDAVPGRINIRAGNGYVVAPPSPGYQMLEGAAVHDAPAALLEHCLRATRTKGEHRSRSGEHSLRDTKSMLRFGDQDGWFEEYLDWISIGAALKLAFLDDGLELWESVTRPGKYTCDEKWPTFADEDDGRAVTLATWFKKARDAGWRLTVDEMFPSVVLAELAASVAPATGRRTFRQRRINAADLAGKPVPEREWLIPDWIPMEQVTLIYGDGAVGKSLLALQLGAAVATGSPWLGLHVRQGPVEFISAEDSADELHRRVVDIARETRAPLESMIGLHVSSFADADAIMAALHGDGQIVETELYDEVSKVIRETSPVLLVLDTLADIFGGNEIIRAQVRAFINMLRKIAIEHRMAIVVLAHPSLSGMSTGRGTSGSTAWSNSVRSRLYFTRVHDEQGVEPDPDARVLRSMKMNYGRVGDEIRMRWRAGIFMPEIGSRRGDPLISAAKAEKVFMDLLRKSIGHNRYVSMSEGRSYAIAIFTSDAAREGVNKKDLKSAMERLLEKGAIENAPYGSPSKKMFRLYPKAAS